jgi:diguanylate cyclase (GGDEF)-like protein/PAS domain S-box-containing protein
VVRVAMSAALLSNALPALVAALIAVGCGIAVIARERFSKSGWLHFFLASGVAAWQLCVAQVLGASSAAEAEYWGRAMAAMAILVPAIQFHFSYSLVRGRGERFDAVTLVWVVAAMLEISLVATDAFVSRIEMHSWGAFPRYGVAGVLFVVSTAASVVGTCFLYLDVIRRNPAGGIAWWRARLLFASLLFGSLGGLDFLPAFGVGVFPFGGLLVALALVLNIYTTIRFRLVEITPALAAQQMMNTMTDGVLLLDRDGMVRLVNPSACETLGYASDQLLHGLPPRPLADLLYGEPHALPCFPDQVMTRVERTYHPPAGGERTLLVSVSHVAPQAGEPLAAIVTLHDETEARKAREQIHRLAYYDALTGLPNRLLLKERFQQAIAWADRAGGQAAVLFLDLDRFKQVNDTLGHDAGDRLLQIVTDRISTCVRDSDVVLRGAGGAEVSTLARLGGDEFVLLLAPVERGEDAAKVAMRILQALAEPVRLDSGDEVVTGASIGIALYPGDGRDADTLMQRADLAMYHAKETGRSNARFYDDALNVATVQRMGMETSLRRALTGHEFLIRYQPVVGSDDGLPVALDTQLFWRHPEHGLLPEREFADVAQDAGLALNLGEWVIRTACHQMRAWVSGGMKPVPLLVTASPALVERGTLVDLLREVLDDSGLDPRQLWVCVRYLRSRTGYGPMGTTLRALATLGVRIVLDEFDAGQMAVTDLIEQPVRTARLSGTWLRNVSSLGHAAVAARALVGLARGLEMEVIAGGVETPGAAALLRSLGCQYQLGPAHGPAVEAEEVPHVLEAARLRLPLRSSTSEA